MNKENVSIFWFRRDLRLDDNIGLSKSNPSLILLILSNLSFLIKVSFEFDSV